MTEITPKRYFNVAIEITREGPGLPQQQPQKPPKHRTVVSCEHLVHFIHHCDLAEPKHLLCERGVEAVSLS